eukprot:TRINITY_DN15381_c0_g1_i1.p1 TRINITY_DN15381_c0_g1~~TRINITY_DN15381_c0_g1_i1.p1  ORF type:complete len:514 (+),score=79.40 TRINITY_DN15381_c0_g1_i1:46-1587(+)
MMFLTYFIAFLLCTVCIATLPSITKFDNGVSVTHNFVSNALGSHMVLQRAPFSAQVWGWTAKGSVRVTVVFNQKQYQTVSNAQSGHWSVMLDPTNAGGPYDINITSSAGESATLVDVLFGDVFVCSGQSNMQFTVHMGFNATAEIAAANNYPNIRVFTAGDSTWSTSPLEEYATILQGWSLASSSSIGMGDWSAFSAICWFFGRDVYDNTHIPIGLISNNWGGTPIQTWSSPDALAKCPLTTVEQEEVEGPNDNSTLWNAMIYPILPLTIKGALWYQGESNVGQPNYYACAFPTMISDWRAKWGGDTDKSFPFYFVQLAPWKSSDLNYISLARLSQMTALTLPHVGVATAMDSGDPSSPFGDVHPRSKQIVSQRLSLIARAQLYQQHVQYLGPYATRWSVVRTGAVRVEFDPATVGKGLVLKQKTCYPNITVDQCREFDIGTSDGQWTKANVVSFDQYSVVLQANLASGLEISGVRYAWANYPIASLYNMDDLPALPFAFPNPIKPTYFVLSK